MRLEKYDIIGIIIRMNPLVWTWACLKWSSPLRGACCWGSVVAFGANNIAGSATRDPKRQNRNSMKPANWWNRNYTVNECINEILWKKQILTFSSIRAESSSRAISLGSSVALPSSTPWCCCLRGLENQNCNCNLQVAPRNLREGEGRDKQYSYRVEF